MKLKDIFTSNIKDIKSFKNNLLSMRIGSGISWSSYWLTRTPSNLTVVVDSTTEAILTWDDGAEAGDGYKLYVDDVYHSTIAYGVGTKTVTGLTLGTDYVFKLVAYKDANESDPDTETLSWAKWMTYSYTDIINTHTAWTADQKILIEGRLSEAYVVTTFGPTGAAKTACDFFIFFETFATEKTTSTTTKTGATLRWNYGGGNIYEENNMPAQVSTTEITITSTDDFGALTRFTFASGQFRNNMPNFPYYFPNITSFQLNGGTIASGTRLKGDITTWGFWKSTMTVFVMTSHDLTGDLTDWIIPNGMRSPNLSSNTYLTGNTPSYNAAWAGTGTSAPNFSDCRFTGIGGTAFPYTRAYTPILSGNCFSTAAIDDFISRLDDWYSANAPQNLSTVDLTGAYNGTITGGDANADLVHLKGVFVTAGYAFTPTYNAETYLLTPLDNPTLCIQVDDGRITDHTKVLPALNTRSIAATCYHPDAWGGAGFLTITEVNVLIAAGWSFEAHPNFSGMTLEAEIRAEMDSLTAFFTANSIPMYNHCSYSGGTYTALVQSIITDYCDTARTVGNWTETSIATRANLIYKDNDVTALRSNSCDPIDAALVLAAKDKLDIAKIKSAGAIMYFHTVTDDDLALILEIVDYAIAEGFDICTIDELHTKMTT